MMMAKLFEPIEVGGLRLANRIVIAPMCQYSAVDGAMTDWHQMHLGQLALSGAGALTIEATAVSPEGRITYGDIGLYDDRTEAAMRSVLESVRRWSDMPLIIQLAHADRKASCAKPWHGGTQIAPDTENGWQTVAPSAIPFAPDDHPSVELDKSGLARIREAFADAARRAGAPAGSASKPSRSTPRMAICSTSFFRRSPTGAATNTAAASTTGCGSRSKCSMPCAKRFPPTDR